MVREAFKEAMERVGAAGGEVGPKAVTTNVFEFVFVG